MCHVKLINVGFLETCYVSRFKGKEGEAELIEKHPGIKKSMENVQNLKVLDTATCIITKLLEYKQVKYI